MWRTECPYHHSTTTDVADNKEKTVTTPDIIYSIWLHQKGHFLPAIGKSSVTCLLQCSHITFWFYCCWHSQKKRKISQPGKQHWKGKLRNCTIYLKITLFRIDKSSSLLGLQKKSQFQFSLQCKALMTFFTWIIYQPASPHNVPYLY